MNKPMTWAALAAILAAVPARAEMTKLTMEWFDPAVLAKTRATAHPDHSAALRRMHEAWLLRWPQKEDPTAQVAIHYALEVLREDGVGAANVSFPVGKDSKLIDLRARTIAPDGTIKEVAKEAIHEAKNTAGEDFTDWKFFRFPRAEVGALLEVIAIFEGPLWNSRSRQILSRQPIDRYQLELFVDPRIDFDVAFFGYDEPLALKTQDGMKHLRMSLDEIPADPREADAPTAPERGPYFMYRALKYAFPKARLTGNLTWGKALTWQTKRLMGRLDGDVEADDRIWDGFDVRVDRGGCDDAPCVIQRALAQAREIAPSKGWGWSVRPMREVLDERAANTWEKNVLLWRLLTDAGVRARLAYAVRKHSGPFVADFPSDFWFDQLLVELPPQDGLAQRAFLDASCESCALGQIPPWVDGVEAIVVTHDDWIFSKVDVAGEVVAVTGEVVAAPAERARAVVKLGDAGAGTVERTYRAAGAAAQGDCEVTRTWSARQWRESAEAVATYVSPRATVTAAPTGACDRAAATYARTVVAAAPDVAQSVVVDGRALLIVPLGMMRATWDGEHRLKPARRTYDIVFESPTDTEDVVEIPIPQGFKVAALPRAWRQEHPGLVVSFTAAEQDGVVRVVRTVDATQGRYRKDTYPALYQALRAFEGARRESVVFERTAAPGGGLAAP